MILKVKNLPMSNKKEFQKEDGFSIDKELYDYINHHLSQDKTILELGSGSGSKYLSEKWVLYSIEHDERFIDFYHNNYIHAPIRDYDNYKWYDKDIVYNAIKDLKYDLILVDGPTGEIGREGFYYNIDMFNLNNVFIIIDDIGRNEEYDLMKKICSYSNKKIIHQEKTFGVCF